VAPVAPVAPVVSDHDLLTHSLEALTTPSPSFFLANAAAAAMPLPSQLCFPSRTRERLPDLICKRRGGKNVEKVRKGVGGARSVEGNEEVAVTNV